MRKTILTFGLIAGAVMSAMLLITVPFQDRLGGSVGMAIGYASMVAASLLIYVGMRQYRDHLRGGAMTYWDGLKVGLAISAVAILCYVLTWEVLYQTVFTDFADKFAAQAVERAQASGLGAEQIAERVASAQRFAEMYKQPLYRAALTMLEPMPVMLLFSFVSAGLLKRRAA